ncbi:MAG: PH domain-containing protein [Aureliella sp.]
MPELVAYDCPTCQEEIAIEPHLFGDVVNCPKCTHPFQVTPPVAEPKDTDPVLEDAEATVTRSADHEVELVSVHPAMFRSRPFTYLLYMSLLVGGLAGGAYFLIFGAVGWIVTAAAWLVALFGAIMLVSWWVSTLTVTVSVSSKRTRIREGLLAKRTSEVQHDDVRNIQVDQTLVQRLLGTGSLSVSSSGQDDLEIIAHNIPNPNEIADLIRARQ